MKKMLAKVFGVVFLLVGVLGFISNPIVGATGYFHADLMHNLVHMLLGIILLVASSTEARAATWLKIVGVVYLLVAILGFAMMPGMNMGSYQLLGLVGINGADNWLHVVLGIVVLLCGFGGGKSAVAAPAAPAQM
jgi:zinc transporter ZupT